MFQTDIMVPETKLMTSKIPLVDLGAQHRAIRDEVLAAVTRCFDSGSYILGEEVERLEHSVAGLCGVSAAVGASSGTDALLMSLMALGVGPGDEVVTTAYSFFGTAGVIARLGAKPVFADIDPGSFNIDPSRIEDAITEKTRLLLPVHLYGRCADMAAILEIAERRDLPVVEDAAQAIGSPGAGSYGAIGCFSFYPSKNLSAVGDAGMAVTSDESLAASLRRLRNHGAETTYRHEVVGGNFRLDAIQAAVLNVKLRHLERWTKLRREKAGLYDELFRERRLVDHGRLDLPAPATDHVYHQYVIRFRERDALREHLARDGIASGVYYPLPLPLQPCFENLGYREGDFPVAERAARETLALPIYPELTEEQQRRVVRSIARFAAEA